jgi:hypothetical protein
LIGLDDGRVIITDAGAIEPCRHLNARQPEAPRLPIAQRIEATDRFLAATGA